METQHPKPCIECNHCHTPTRLEIEYLGRPPSWHRCANLKTARADAVLGRRWGEIEAIREDKENCGPDGAFWEAKPDEPPKNPASSVSSPKKKSFWARWF